MKFTTKSGSEIFIGDASFEEAQELRFALEKAILQAKHSISLESLSSIADIDVMEVAKLFMLVDSSKEVNEAIWPCLNRCTRNKERITKAVFNDMDARKDYFEIVGGCIRHNMTPFGESLFLGLSGLLKQRPKEGQEQK